MRTIRALLVAIDDYRPPVTRLSGCNNDIDRVAAFLGSRVEPGTDFDPLFLRDAAATRAAVIAAFERHLSAAGPQDTALFWFSGHGSDAPCLPQLRHLEPSGRMQTLLCHDSRHGGVPELLDKELALLVEDVAAGGAHVAVVLDCCHSGGGTRDEVAGRSSVRGVDGAAAPPSVDLLLPRLRRMIADGSAATLRPSRTSHIALSACQPHQRANELPPLQGRRYGAFSTALLNAAHRLGPAATYRELLTAASCDVETVFADQRPMLDPGEPGLADQPFLGGRIRPAASAMTLRYAAREWQVGVGACHGLPAAGDPFGDPYGVVRFAVPGTDPPRTARVVRTLTRHCVVELDGWDGPGPRRQTHPVVLTEVPLPRAAVAIEPGRAAGAIVDAIRHAGPDGGPSPHVREARPGEAAGLRVELSASGTVRIVGPDGGPLVAGRPGAHPDAARAVVRDLEHISRWRRVRSLRNPASGLGTAVRLECHDAGRHERRLPPGRPPLVPGADGVLRLRYRRAPDGGWEAPAVFVRLRNTTGRPLYCALLDLTDRFAVHPVLFPGWWVEGDADAADGAPVEFTIPADRPVRPGAVARDWLMLLVSEADFSTASFALHPLGEPEPWPDRGPAPGSGRSAPGFTNVLDRLGAIATQRTAPAGRPAAADWSTTVVPVFTEVPLSS